MGLHKSMIVHYPLFFNRVISIDLIGRDPPILDLQRLPRLWDCRKQLNLSHLGFSKQIAIIYGLTIWNAFFRAHSRMSAFLLKKTKSPKVLIGLDTNRLPPWAEVTEVMCFEDNYMWLGSVYK